jgi:poly(3-hydroxyoctanoate) depolymerase
MTARLAAARERVLRVGRDRIHVRVHGEGEPVLLINGLGANIAMWSSLEELLSGFEVISYDATGTGHSSTPWAPYTIAQAAKVACGVLDATGHDQADVLGYSLGGAVAQSLAVQRPERIRRLVLAGTSCGIGAFPASLRAMLALLTPIRYYSDTAHKLATAMMTVAPAERDSSLLERTARERRTATPTMRGYSLQVAAFSTFSSLPWLHRITAPTLVMTGTDDTLLPAANSVLLAAHLPNARLARYERWGHYLLHDARSGAGAAVADFFGAQRPERSRAWRDAETVTAEDLAGLIRSAPATAHPSAIVNMLARQLFPPRSAGGQ